MLTTEQQQTLRRELLRSLTPGNKYDEAGLRVRFKQTLLSLARKGPLPADDIADLVASSGGDVFRDYAVGGAGGGIGLFALIRVYGDLRGPGPAAELRERMQQLAEENAIRGASEEW